MKYKLSKYAAFFCSHKILHLGKTRVKLGTNASDDQTTLLDI